MYLTFKQFVSKYEWPTISGLRSIYFHAAKEKNAFLPAFSKIGKRLLVDPIKFFMIVENDANKHNQAYAAT